MDKESLEIIAEYATNIIRKIERITDEWCKKCDIKDKCSQCCPIKEIREILEVNHK